MPLFGKRCELRIIGWRQPIHSNCSSFDKHQSRRTTMGSFPREDPTSAHCHDSEKKNALQGYKISFENLRGYPQVLSATHSSFSNNTVKIAVLGKTSPRLVLLTQWVWVKMGFLGITLVNTAVELNHLLIDVHRHSWGLHGLLGWGGKVAGPQVPCPEAQQEGERNTPASGEVWWCPMVVQGCGGRSTGDSSLEPAPSEAALHPARGGGPL